MERNCNVPIQVLTVCDADGRLQPIRFRVEDEAHELQTVSIKQVVSTYEIQYVGIEALAFLCKGDIGGREHLFELRYTVRSHRWALQRLIY